MSLESLKLVGREARSNGKTCVLSISSGSREVGENLFVDCCAYNYD